MTLTEWPNKKEKVALISRVEEVEDVLDSTGYGDVEEFITDQLLADKWRSEKKDV